MTGERKNPARIRKLMRLSTSGILHEMGAKSNPIPHPVKESRISQKGRNSKFQVTGKS
jgi:hypothetical protein